MGNELVQGIVSVSLAIVGVAIIATLVSRNANTAGVLSAGGGALATGLAAAEGPVTGASNNTLFSGLNGWTGGAPYMSGDSVLG